MSSSKSFVREAVILTAANFAVKIIGVVFKIPLTNIMGPSIGIFTAAYSIYAMLFMLSTSGLPVAISRLVSASNSRGRGVEAKRISRISSYLFGVIGFVFMVLLVVFAPFIAKISGHEDSVVAMRVIAPALFFVCVTSSVRGYFQGLRNMYPTAISQFIEAFFKLAVGLGAVMIAEGRGASPAVQAGCAILGVSVGSMIAMVFILVYRSVYGNRSLSFEDSSCESDKRLAKTIILVAVPITLTAAALYFSQFLDTLVIVNCLENSGESHLAADTLFSAYTGLSVPIYDLLPGALVFPIATSILPAVSGALAKKDYSEASSLTVQSIRISGIIAIPCAAFLFVTGRSCISFLYGAEKWSQPILMANGEELLPIDAATNCLLILAVAVFFISAVSTTNSLLNAYGKAHLPFVSVLCGLVALVVSEILLIYSPAGIYGAPISSIICYAITLSLNIFFLRKYCGVRVRIAGMFARPLLCGAVTCGVTYAVYNGAEYLWKTLVGGSTDTRLAAFCLLCAAGVTLVVSYCVCVLVFRGIKEEEVRLLPKGNFIADLLLKKGWLK